MDIKNKIIELNNGDMYVVADTIPYINKTFLALSKIILETQEVGEIELYEMENNKLEKVLSPELIENLKKIFEMNNS